MTLPGQIHFDNLTPAEDPDVPQIELIETAQEFLDRALTAYRHNPPKWSEGAGLVMDAAFELKKIN